MPSRASDSARFGPTPFRYFTEVVSDNDTPFPLSPFPGRSPAHQAPGVGLGVEHLKIVESFAGPEEADRDAHRALERNDASALAGAVELGHDQPAERNRRGEGPRLMHRVLSYRGVEHEQRLVRRARLLLRDDAHHFLQLRE